MSDTETAADGLPEKIGTVLGVVVVLSISAILCWTVLRGLF